MPSIEWNEGIPPDTESAGLGDDRIRSLKTSIRVGLDGEHVWPSGGGDAGVHRLGSGRPYYGAQSLVSSSGSDARLMVTSDTSRLFHVGSAGTAMLGGITVLSVGSFPGTVPQRHYWATEFGDGQTSSNGSVTVTIPNSGFSGVPWIVATVNNSVTPLARMATVYNKGKTTFIVATWDAAGVATNGTLFDWISVGTRVL